MHTVDVFRQSAVQRRVRTPLNLSRRGNQEKRTKRCAQGRRVSDSAVQRRVRTAWNVGRTCKNMYEHVKTIVKSKEL